MHPKNTTAKPEAQAALATEVNSLNPPLTTEASPFHKLGDGFFCTTIASAPCSDAINFASSILQSAACVCRMLIDDEQSASAVHAVLVLIENAKALVDSTVRGIELAEGGLGGAQ